ncbi:hypothetical protein NKR23_g12484 [Pleurostoma richardsiae]|uniref:Uncharacterized protein n=1 Tax=Pleurostoma richardsiae TaxID=41990 RepID=A0AA38RFT5_9PEZI|nr:hypothetical protein NKR23_g12484 [Pleurostoma richardsiae]
MSTSKLSSGKTFCGEIGKSHHDIFMARPGLKFCEGCGFPNPAKLRSKPPSLPGPDDSIVDLDPDSSPDIRHQRRGSPASQLMREKPVAPASSLREAQLLPNDRDLASHGAGVRSRGVALADRPKYVTVAQVASEAIEAQKKGGGRKATRAGTFATMISVTVLVVVKQRSLLHGRIPIDTVLSVKEVAETSIRFLWSELSAWDVFLEVLVSNLTKHPDIANLSITNRQLWLQSWASSTNGKNKITNVPVSETQTPRQWIDSGHFQNTQQQLKKLYYVLTSTTVEEEESDIVGGVDTPDSAVERKHRLSDVTPSPALQKKAVKRKRTKKPVTKDETLVKEEPAVKEEQSVKEEIQTSGPPFVSRYAAEVDLTDLDDPNFVFPDLTTMPDQYEDEETSEAVDDQSVRKPSSYYRESTD